MKRGIFHIILLLLVVGGKLTAQDSIHYTLVIHWSNCNGANNGYAEVNASGVHPPYSYSWSTGATTNSIGYLPPGDYSVLITDAILNDTLVHVYIGEANCPISPELSFTPNSDGYNDAWAINNIQYYPDNKILIYNRWGQKVYEHNGAYTPWDGRDLFGVPVPDASYFYIIYGERGDDSTIIKGSVSILR